MTTAATRLFCHFRRQGARADTTLLLMLAYGLALLFLRLESPAWQAVLKNRQRLFPQFVQKIPSPGDLLRLPIQGIWLLLVRRPAASLAHPFMHQLIRFAHRGLADSQRLWQRLGQKAGQQVKRLQQQAMAGENRPNHGHSRLTQQAGQWFLLLLAGLLAILCITEPFSYEAQVIFVLVLWGLALLLRQVHGRFSTLMLIVLSVIISCRYLWWRYTATLNWNDSLDLVCGLVLLTAETYSWVVLMLGYFQTSWPLNRDPLALPDDRSLWPTVDLFIPTYNEDLAVVRTTVFAAMGLDWPKERLRIYLLDDGRRQTFREFAAEVGVGYLTRPDNQHAKAGNLNHALQLTCGELVAIFDCDHRPVRSFLQLTVGWFLQDTKLALVQTPHHFFSPDPFERNLGFFRKRPNEGELFYGLIQDGNDLWNAAFFCGSCAVVRRKALEDIGGFAVETVTEDAHTALRMHRAGWHSAYIRIPLAAGLATESLSAHIGQRIRWARGMVQIFRMDNPLLGRGLALSQRLCYANAMLHFMAGLPRIIFLTAPLAFLLLHAYIIYAPAAMILLYVLPHMVHASLANSRLQGPFRHPFWGDVYETVLAWYIAWPTTVALFSPGRGKFNVTAKGGLMEHNQLDWDIIRPYLLLVLLNVAGMGFAIWRLEYGPEPEIFTVIVSTLWSLYNLLIIGAAIAVAAEVRQIRQTHRVQTELPAALRLPGGHLHACELVDYSEGGAGLQMHAPDLVREGDRVQLLLGRGEQEFVFDSQVIRCAGHSAGLAFNYRNLQQRIDFVSCTFARADAWLNWNSDREIDQPLYSFIEVLRFGMRGYYRLLKYLPEPVYTLVWPVVALLRWLLSYLPRMPAAR